MPTIRKRLKATLKHPLNARSPGARFAALGRSLRWKIAVRLPPDAELDQLYDSMAALGFTPHHYDALTRTLSSARPDDPEHINTLFLKDVALVTQRTREAPAATLINGSL